MPRQRTEEERQKDREWKQMKRRTDPLWLAAERARRRIYGKERKRNPAKYRQYAKTYRSKKRNLLKEKARALVKIAIERGEIKVPKICELCKKKPKPFRTNRRPLRADHYQGHDKPYIVRFICVDCDGKQLRAKNALVK
jgi:hypothetical protein